MSPIAVITGTTHGIGRVTSRELARAGRTVVMLCRDLRAAEQVRGEILALLPHAAVQIEHCDLASLESVRRCAEAVRRRFGPIGLLINNAGLTSTRRRMSPDGFELTFAVNHLGPFLLTALLLEQLDEEARVINVASRAHLRGRMELAAVTNPRGRYRATEAYARSKLANVMHALALARRFAGTRRTANCLHPGVVATNLLPRWLRLVKPLVSHVVDAERGAVTTLHLALASEMAGVNGRYFDENQHPQAPAPIAADVDVQESLWRASARWTGAPT